MQVQFELHTQGPWFGSSSPQLIYNGTTYGYANNPSFPAEATYLQGKFIVASMIASAVDDQLPSLAVADRNNIIDAICASWVTKVNMGYMTDGTIACNLMIPNNAGGLEVRTSDNTIHYWTAQSVDQGDVTSILKAQIQVLVGKVYAGVTAKIPNNTARAYMFMRMILKDVFDQFVIIVS